MSAKYCLSAFRISFQARLNRDQRLFWALLWLFLICTPRIFGPLNDIGHRRVFSKSILLGLFAMKIILGTGDGFQNQFSFVSGFPWETNQAKALLYTKVAGRAKSLGVQIKRKPCCTQKPREGQKAKEYKLRESLAVPKSRGKGKKPGSTNQAKALLCPKAIKRAKSHGECFG